MKNLVINLDEDRKRILENAISLYILQGLNYILPLITMPYLVRVLGPEKFGLISFSQAFIQYFVILTDYGFNLSATREISINRENKAKVSEIFSTVMIIKFFLLVVSFIIMSIIVFSFERFRKDWIVYYLTFGIVIGQVLFPVWFFQGMERMKYITGLNAVSKIFFTVTIFIFVHKSSNYIYVPLINSLGFLIAGILSMWFIFKNFNIFPYLPKMSEIKYQLSEGWYVFVSTVAISLYTISNTFILGLFTNNIYVGYYAAGEKIIRAVQGLLTPVSQAIYPYISKLIVNSKEKGIDFLKKITLLIGVVSFILSLSLYFFSPIIVKFILGYQYEKSIYVLRILAFLPFLIALSNIFGIQTMLPLNYKKAFTTILVSASIINIILTSILSPIFKHIGVSISVFVSELFVTVTMFLFLQRKGINLLRY